MKQCLILVLVFFSMIAFGQKEKAGNDFLPSRNRYRILKSDYYEGRKTPVFTTDYIYDKQGLIQSVSRKYFSNEAWLDMDTRNYYYDARAGTIVCVYKPSEDALKDNEIKNYIKNNIGDADTLRFVKGKLIYLHQFRKGPYNEHLTSFDYTYDLDKIESVKKTTYTYIEKKTKEGKILKPYLSKDKVGISVVYENGELKKIIQTNGYQDQQWVFKRNEKGLNAIDLFNLKEGEETLVGLYESQNAQNHLSRLTEFSLYNDTKNQIQEWSYKYDENGSLIETLLFDDSGASGYRFTYETGNGNISLFQEKQSAYDFLHPSIK